MAEPRKSNLLKEFVPAIRADLVLGKTPYVEGAPFDLPLTFISSKDDQGETTAKVDHWRAQTTNNFVHHIFPGPHLLITEKPDMWIAKLNEILNGVISSL